MTKRLSLLLFTLLIVATLCSSSFKSVLAATSPSNPSQVGQALEIAPPVVNLTVSPGQTTSVQILLRDISTGNLLVTGTANDFLAAGEDGTPKVILDDQQNNPYSMKSWVGPLPSLLLVPHEIKSMTVTLHVPKDASPGGHYGVIRFTATPPELQDTGVSLAASLGALMLVTVTGKINENVSLQTFDVSQNDKVGNLFENSPLTFSELFKNTGNVHEQPVGEVIITDTFGRKTASLSVNQPPKNILPASERRFSQSLDQTVIGNEFLFGRYTAKLAVTYGTSKQAINGQISFWVIPYRLMAIIVVALIGGFFLLRFLITRYNRHIIAQADRRRR